MTTRDYKHQDEAFAASKGRKFFGYWMAPGTGKTRVTLLDAWRAYDGGEIDAVLVMAPNNVKDSWVKWPHMVEDEPDQVDQWLPEHKSKIIKGIWIGSGDATKQDKKCWAEFEDRISNRHHKLVILSINYEALLSEQFFEFLKAFCTEYRVMVVADESTRIGKPGSQRTKRATKLSDLASLTRALSGTPIVKTPLKMYSQARFLSRNAIPFKSYYAFRNMFCNMGGFQGRQVLSYKNLDYLSNLIASFGIVVEKSVLGLKDPQYRKRRVYMTPEQTKAYKTMREEFFAEVNGEEITATIVLAQITRLQQIAGGYLVNKDGEVIELIPPDRNPKLLEALELIDNAPGQVVVWFRFVPELLGMKRLLEQVNKTRNKNREAGEPVTFVEFHGAVPKKDRGGIKAAFKRGDFQVLLGTEGTGGIGINEFVGADTVIHVSSDFDTEKRIQADDRNHRIGSEVHVNGVTYYDILVPNTVDVKIHRVLRNDTKLSAQILKTQWKEWI
jgi:hypothetical protein